MSAIDEYLQQILDAVYGEEVRGAIHDAIWQVYEDGQAGVPMSRTINGKPLSSDITLSASDVGAVPTARTVNNKALSSNVTLSASDVGAVPTTLTVNSKPLSSNITLSASDVGAVNKTGDTMTGQLNTPGINSYASSWPGYGFALSSDPTTVLVSLNYDQNANKFTFVSGSNDGTGSTEAFSLPKPTATDGNWHNYDILTTRSAVSIGQGGTGATTAAEARTNLGLGSLATKSSLTASDIPALSYLPLSGGTTSGDITIKGPTYPSFALKKSDGTALGSLYASVNSGRMMIRTWNSTGTKYTDYCLPDDSDNDADRARYFLTTKDFDFVNYSGTSGTAPGVVKSGAGIWLVSAYDSNDPSKYWVGIVVKRGSTNPTVTKLVNSTITCSGGNTIGTLIFSGGNSYTVKTLKIA